HTPFVQSASMICISTFDSRGAAISLLKSHLVNDVVESTTAVCNRANEMFAGFVSIRRRLLDAVDDEYLNRTSSRLQLQAELSFKRRKQGRSRGGVGGRIRVCRQWIRIEVQSKVIETFKAGFVDHGAAGASPENF